MRQSFLWLEIPAYKYFPTHLMERCGPKQWAHLRLLQAFERLNIPSERWPKFPFPVLPRPYYHFYRASDCLSLPHFYPLYESEAEWKTRVQSDLEKFVENELEGFRRQLERDLKTGFLTPIKQPRDAIELRYEWAAERLCYHTPYRELAKRYFPRGEKGAEDRIRQAATKVIREAGLRQVK